jgi:hypothetical protein
MSFDKLRSRRSALKCMAFGGAGTQPVAGEGADPGPLKVPPGQLPSMLGVSSVTVVEHSKSLTLTDTTLA